MFKFTKQLVLIKINRVKSYSVVYTEAMVSKQLFGKRRDVMINEGSLQTDHPGLYVEVDAFIEKSNLFVR
jgi:hypothetical protein